MTIKKSEFNVTQSVGGNNYGNMVASKGNVNAVNLVTQNDKEEIESIIKYLKTTILTQSIKDDEKEIVLDDLDTIEDQISSENPKKVKIKKAYEGIKKFVSNLPDTLVKATLIVSKVEELYSKLKPFIE